MKGIILAGGSGTRLYPLTKVVSKQLMPIYNKPMIYYPLSVLMQAEIREILIITTPDDVTTFMKLLGDGSNYGIKLSYEIQASPNGLAEAFLIGEEFIGDDDVAMVLGDNIFYGDNLKEKLLLARNNVKNNKATVFGYKVDDPERFGVVEFDLEGKVISVEEKPKEPKSNYAITGLYFYDNSVKEMAKKVKPSVRKELEITDLNKLYLEQGNLDVITMDKGYCWFDTGTFASLQTASNFVEYVEENQRISICCPEEIGYLNGWLSKEKLIEKALEMEKNTYGQNLLALVENSKVKLKRK